MKSLIFVLSVYVKCLELRLVFAEMMMMMCEITLSDESYISKQYIAVYSVADEQDYGECGLYSAFRKSSR